MRLDALAGLITAVFELKAVRAVTNAVNANLPRDGPLGTIRPTAADLYREARPYEPSGYPNAGPTPRYVERASGISGPVFDYYDRFGCVYRSDAAAPDVGCGGDAVELWTLDGPTPPRTPGPIDPPWRHLPPVEAPGRVEVRVVRPRVVLGPRGTMLDVFA